MRDEAPWKPVMGPGGYWPGFDTKKLYEFRRGLDGPVKTFRMTDTYPAFNVWNLYWRENRNLSSCCSAEG